MKRWDIKEHEELYDLPLWRANQAWYYLKEAENSGWGMIWSHTAQIPSGVTSCVIPAKFSLAGQVVVSLPPRPPDSEALYIQYVSKSRDLSLNEAYPLASEISAS